MFRRIAGLVFLAGGSVLLWWGYNISKSVGSQLHRAFTGAPQDKALYMYIGGGVCLTIGLYKTLSRK